MWYASTVSVAAQARHITLSEAKAHCRVDHADDDAVLLSMVNAACAHVELYCGVRFISQTLTLKCDAFADFARLPEGPIASITSIAYVDVDGNTQTLATSVYELRVDGYEAAIVRKFNQSWPTPRVGSQITVTAVAGAAAAPADVKAATLLLIGHLYAHREAGNIGNIMTVIPMGVDALLANHRRYA